jgi:hypothetical protein
MTAALNMLTKLLVFVVGVVLVYALSTKYSGAEQTFYPGADDMDDDGDDEMGVSSSSSSAMVTPMPLAFQPVPPKPSFSFPPKPSFSFGPPRPLEIPVSYDNDGDDEMGVSSSSSSAMVTPTPLAFQPAPPTRRDIPVSYDNWDDDNLGLVRDFLGLPPTVTDNMLREQFDPHVLKAQLEPVIDEIRSRDPGERTEVIRGTHPNQRWSAAVDLYLVLLEAETPFKKPKRDATSVRRSLFQAWLARRFGS